MAEDTFEIAQALAVACLNQPGFIDRVTFRPVPSTRGSDAGFYGDKVGEFYQAIYKAVLETPDKAHKASKS